MGLELIQYPKLLLSKDYIELFSTIFIIVNLKTSQFTVQKYYQYSLSVSMIVVFISYFLLVYIRI